MTGPEHYKEAERLLGTDYPPETAKAQVHATLALAAATVAPEYHRLEWRRSIGVKPGEGA